MTDTCEGRITFRARRPAGRLAAMALATLLALGLCGLAATPAKAQDAAKALRKLEMIRIAMLITQYERRFKEAELARLRDAIPTVQKENPKLYDDRDKTHAILMLYMVLDEIEHAEKSGAGLKSLVGKTGYELAESFIARTFKGAARAAGDG